MKKNFYPYVNEKDAKFIIKKDERKVICIISNTKYLVFESLGDPLFSKLGICSNLHSIEKSLMIPNKFTGIATCAPDDEWDEAIGRKLAFYKAQKKYNESIFKRYNLYVRTIDRWLDECVNNINRVGEKLSKNAEAEERRLKEMIDEKGE